jgi:CheY-like chemotaxis protein
MPDNLSPTALPLRVFVVENHEDTMRALEFYIRQLGHSVQTARSVGEALKALPRTECDVLISDIGLPDGSGWDLLARANLPASVHCVAISGFGLGADRDRSAQAGYRAHLLKPLDPDQIDQVLEDAQRERASFSRH